MLPFYLKNFPFYDRALPRIATKLREIDRHLTVIDIGANIGDTVSLISSKVVGQFLCIEGDKKYLPILRKNVSKLKKVKIKIEPAYCSESDNQIANLSIENKNGTAKLIKSNKSTIENFKTLNTIIDEHNDFLKSNLLKIDTDGFEINILRGGDKFIPKSHPVIFSEFTPALYNQLNQDPLELIKLLVKYGYVQALFYDNYGRPKQILNLTETEKIKKLISLIDEKNIYYYDILAIHQSDQNKYSTLLQSELISHIDKLNKLYEAQQPNILDLETRLESKIKKIEHLGNAYQFVETELQRILPEFTAYKIETKKTTQQLIKSNSVSKQKINNLLNQNKHILNELNSVYKSSIWNIISKYYTIREKLFQNKK